MLSANHEFKMKHRHLDGDRSVVQIMPTLHWLTHNDPRLETYPFRLNRWSGHEEKVAEWFLRDGLHKNLVEKFKVTTGVMQNPVTIAMAVENFVVINGRRGFQGEFILAPQYHVFGDHFSAKGELDEKTVVEKVIIGIKDGKKKLKAEGINASFRAWFGLGREVTLKMAMRLAKAMLECDPEFVLGLSLVCHEPSGPPEKFIEPFRLAKQEGRKTACHVEWVKDREEHEKNTPEKIRRNFQEDLPQLTKNLKTAIFDLEVDQLDHGFGLGENPELIKAVVDKGIVVTWCPGSLLTTHVIDSIRMMKIPEMLEAGVLGCWDVDDDICMPAYHKLKHMYEEDYGKPPSAENLERMNANLAQLEKNAELAQFGNRKEYKF